MRRHTKRRQTRFDKKRFHSDSAGLLALLLASLLSGPAYSQTPVVVNETAKLTASDGDVGDYFGFSTAVAGDTAVVGSRYDIDIPPRAGSAYVFERNQGGPARWGEVKKLFASDRGSQEQFSESVAISGDTIVVGADFDDDFGDESGSAYVFDRDSGGSNNWGQVKKLLPSDGAPGHRFGIDVAIDGDIIVVGAFGGDAAYVFHRNQGGLNNWGEVKRLRASIPTDWGSFGTSVSVFGDLSVVGSECLGCAGSVYIFERNQGGANNWGEVKTLEASDPTLSFGVSVAAWGDTIAVGAHLDNDNGEHSGAAYIYERNQGGLDNWGELKKLIASDGAAGDLFGLDVALSGDTLIVGAWRDDDSGENSGSAYIYERNQGGRNNWGELQKLIASDGSDGDALGRDVSVSVSTALAGAFGDDSAYMFPLGLGNSGRVLYTVAPFGALSVVNPDLAVSSLVGPLDSDPAAPFRYSFPESLAARPSGGRLYTWANSTAALAEGLLLTINPCTGAAKPVGPADATRVDIKLSGLAFAPDGQLFGARSEPPYELIRINPETGAPVSFHPLGVSAPLSLAFDSTGTLRGASSADFDAILYEIDPTSGRVVSQATLDLNVSPILSFTYDSVGNVVGSSDKVLFTADSTGRVTSFQELTGDIDDSLGMPRGMAYGLPCAVNVAPLELNFGDVAIGAQSGQIVTVSNVGSEAFSLDSVSDPSGPFSVNAALGEIAPGASRDVEVYFAPTSEGLQTTAVVIGSSLQEVSVALVGDGVQNEQPPDEQVEDILGFFDDSVGAGTLTGKGNGNSAQRRLGALRNMIEAAGDLLGDPAEACNQLQDAYLRVDGNSPPPDFADGESAEELVVLIQALRGSLSCP